MFKKVKIINKNIDLKDSRLKFIVLSDKTIDYYQWGLNCKILDVDEHTARVWLDNDGASTGQRNMFFEGFVNGEI